MVTSFRTALGQWSTPASVLTDNGAILTVKQRGEGRVALEVDHHSSSQRKPESVTDNCVGHQISDIEKAADRSQEAQREAKDFFLGWL